MRNIKSEQLNAREFSIRLPTPQMNRFYCKRIEREEMAAHTDHQAFAARQAGRMGVWRRRVDIQMGRFFIISVPIEFKCKVQMP